MTKDEVQALLIRSIHSDKDAEGILSAERGKQSVFDIIAEIVETSESGDARMEGAYWLSSAQRLQWRSHRMPQTSRRMGRTSRSGFISETATPVEQNRATSTAMYFSQFSAAVRHSDRAVFWRKNSATPAIPKLMFPKVSSSIR